LAAKSGIEERIQANRGQFCHVIINKIEFGARVMRKVILTPAEEGGYIVEVPSLPGCYSQGDTYDEAIENIKDAIEAFIESMRKHGEVVPPEIELL
jgi:predicted RNase H-like HicB family nuclease